MAWGMASEASCYVYYPEDESDLLKFVVYRLVFEEQDKVMAMLLLTESRFSWIYQVGIRYWSGIPKMG